MDFGDAEGIEVVGTSISFSTGEGASVSSGETSVSFMAGGGVGEEESVSVGEAAWLVCVGDATSGSVWA